MDKIADKKERQREYQRKYREANREKVRAASLKYAQSRKGRVINKASWKKWQVANPEKVKQCARDYHAANKASILDRNKWYKIQRQFGLSKVEYESLLNRQGRACACCKTTEPKSRGGKDWCVDHCHTTGVVRGLLCSHCNTGIGLAAECTTILQSWINYLSRDVVAVDIKRK